MRFRILDRYILKEMTGPFFAGLVVYSFLFLINLIFQLASLAIQQGLAPTVTGLLFLLSLPSILAYTTPIAILFPRIESNVSANPGMGHTGFVRHSYSTANTLVRSSSIAPPIRRMARRQHDRAVLTRAGGIRRVGRAGIG